MLVLGCDLSLAATGLVVWDHAAQAVSDYELVRTHKVDEPYDLQRRVHEQWRRVRHWATQVDRIAIEGCAFGASHGDTRPVAVYEVVSYRLWRAKYMWTVVSTNTVKKHATGRGNASKGEMVEAANAAGFLPIVTKSLANNLADAYWVARWYSDTFMP